MADCKVCDKADDDKPLCFQREDWCSDIHRKIVIGELPPEADFRFKDEEK